ncbi:1-acyl-sn-glycerol-3-phosphate acyltransferase [Candidatus Woesearchaeota archaeon]|nr:1-acyl-sn-glycerol-3-phosphate acyltransferase [Candidatus Woesearchaeota archaeon]
MRPFQVARYIFSPVLKLWIRKVNGIENLPTNRPFILAPNHCSYMEHFLIGAVIIPHLSKKLHFIAKKEHFQSIAQSSWHSLWEKYTTYIPIDREKGEEAIKAAVSYLRKGAVIVIYPEGTRSLTGKIQKGKTGVSRLALWARVPVVPLGIKGAFEILPKGKKIPRLKKADLSFGKPMYFGKYYNKPINKKILKEITTKIMKEIARLSGQEYNY